MSQLKENSMHVEPSLPQSTEAAVKLLHQASSTKTSDGGPTDKDGFEGSGTDVDSFFIDVASNGFLLTINCEDGLQEKTVHEHLDEVLEIIRTRF